MKKNDFEGIFTIDISFNPDSGNFLINFSDEIRYIVSVKVEAPIAARIAAELDLKIST